MPGRTRSSPTVDRRHEARRGDQRVAPPGHRKAAALHRLAAEAYGVALVSRRAGHGRERQVLALEDRALLDVELEVGTGARQATGGLLGRAAKVHAVLGHRVDQGDPPGVAQPRDLVVVDRPRRAARAEQAAAEARALLVGPVHQRDAHGRLVLGAQAP
jgi:hypothetical protein